jgi:hypothetical protein
MFCKPRKKKKKKKQKQKSKYPEERKILKSFSHNGNRHLIPTRTRMTREQWIRERGMSQIRTRKRWIERYEAEIERQAKFFDARPNDVFTREARQRLARYRGQFPHESQMKPGRPISDAIEDLTQYVPNDEGSSSSSSSTTYSYNTSL